ncbi:MAG: DUF4131 domain-containing protein, partial [Minisyncoccales bacterium]
MNLSWLFFLSLASFTLGNFIFSFFSFIPFFLFLLFGLLFFILLKKERLSFLFFFLFFLFGFFYTKSAFLKVEKNSLSHFYGKKVQLRGKIVSEAYEWRKGWKYYFQPDNFKEKILVFFKRAPLFQYGDRLVLEGKLKKIEGGEE